MEAMRGRILELLARSNDGGTLINHLSHLVETEGPDTCVALFQILTSMDLTPDEAMQHWIALVSHHGSLQAALGRQVTLATAACDYFSSQHRTLHTPKIIEVEAYERTARSSRVDGLTGLLNRATFDERLHQEVSRAKRHDIDLALVLFDLDHFKQVNDTFGHLAGDAVLKAVAGAIMTEKRSEDIAARFGGEELTVLMPETGKQEALVLAERIRRRVEAMRVPYEGQQIAITISGGIASCPVDAMHETGLVQAADRALYRSKDLGRNRTALNSSDKRRNLRLSLPLQIDIAPGHRQERHFFAEPRNISIGGLLLHSPQPLSVNSDLQLVLEDNGVPIEISGNVVRLFELPEGGYEVGVAFHETFLDRKKQLASCLLATIRNEPPQPRDFIWDYEADIRRSESTV